MVYVFARFLLRLYIKLFYGWRVEGMEHFPPEGPVIACANHFSWLDPPLIGCILRRRISFMAKEEFFRLAPVAWLFHQLGVIPVKRGRADRTAIREGLRILKEGGVLGIFPEGTRSRDGRLQEFQPGTALLAFRSGASVVPMGIVGPYRPFHRIMVRVGKPIKPPSGDGADLRAFTEELRAAVEALRRPD